MRLIEAILQENQRAVSPRQMAASARQGQEPSLPLVILSCIDMRLNPLIPHVLGVGEEDVVWLRNAGNVVTGPSSSTMRSLALACAIKGGREIAVIGHTDCMVGKTTMLGLLEKLQGQGVDRAVLPENLVAFFGLFASERQNVIQGAEHVRSSPLIGPRVPVHGLLLDVVSGRLEWVVNGYEALEAATVRMPGAAFGVAAAPESQATTAAQSQDGQPPAQRKIGEVASNAAQWLADVALMPKGGSVQPVVEVVKAAVDWSAKLDKAIQYRVIGSDQKVYGPIGGLTILKWIGEGRIGADTPAQPEGSTEWKPLAGWAGAELRRRLPLPPRLETLKKSFREGLET
jgi:carbonic anhydrase